MLEVFIGKGREITLKAGELAGNLELLNVKDVLMWIVTNILLKLGMSG